MCCNNSYMNCCAPRWNFMAMRFFMPAQNFAPLNFWMPMQSSCMMNYFRPTNVFQNYFRPTNYYPRQYYYAPQSVQTVQTLQQAASTSQTQNTELIFGAPYNKQKGELLAKNIVDILPQNREQPLCAKYVKMAVEKSGLGPYVLGNGEACKNIFRANPNFKEVKVKGKDFENLPKGSIIVYDAGTKVKYKNGNETKIGADGHVLITIGNGKGCSDVIENEILQSDNAYTFIPI